jgi:hypothetical protein
VCALLRVASTTEIAFTAFATISSQGIFGLRPRFMQCWMESLTGCRRKGEGA